MALGHRRGTRILSLSTYTYLLIIVDLLANAFLAWIQAKNEAEAETEERILKAHKYYQRKLKKKIIKNWKVHQTFLHMSYVNVNIFAIIRLLSHLELSKKQQRRFVFDLPFMYSE